MRSTSPARGSPSAPPGRPTAAPRSSSPTTPRPPAGRAEVVVAYDGPGVPPQDQDRIFLRFVTTRPGGNGLGLSTSREIAQAHGGSLTLRGGQSGATFVPPLPPARNTQPR